MQENAQNAGQSTHNSRTLSGSLSLAGALDNQGCRVYVDGCQASPLEVFRIVDDTGMSSKTETTR